MSRNIRLCVWSFHLGRSSSPFSDCEDANLPEDSWDIRSISERLAFKERNRSQFQLIQPRLLREGSLNSVFADRLMAMRSYSFFCNLEDCQNRLASGDGMDVTLCWILSIWTNAVEVAFKDLIGEGFKNFWNRQWRRFEAIDEFHGMLELTLLLSYSFVLGVGGLRWRMWSWTRCPTRHWKRFTYTRICRRFLSEWSLLSRRAKTVLLFLHGMAPIYDLHALRSSL